jgi:hypothetical protein
MATARPWMILGALAGMTLVGCSSGSTETLDPVAKEKVKAARFDKIDANKQKAGVPAPKK